MKSILAVLRPRGLARPGVWILGLWALLSPVAGSAKSILELWEHVVSSNPTLRASEHAVEQARAQQDQAFSKLLPTSTGTQGPPGCFQAAIPSGHG